VGFVVNALDQWTAAHPPRRDDAAIKHHTWRRDELLARAAFWEWRGEYVEQPDYIREEIETLRQQAAEHDAVIKRLEAVG